MTIERRKVTIPPEWPLCRECERWEKVGLSARNELLHVVHERHEVMAQISALRRENTSLKQKLHWREKTIRSLERRLENEAADAVLHENDLAEVMEEVGVGRRR